MLFLFLFTEDKKGGFWAVFSGKAYGVNLNFRHTGVVELEKFVFVLSGPDAHGGAGVLIEDAGDYVRDKGAPFLGAAHGH